MKAKRYTEEQIIAVLKEGEAGAKVSDLCRKYGMNDAAYYNWKAKYAGLTVTSGLYPVVILIMGEGHILLGIC